MKAPTALALCGATLVVAVAALSVRHFVTSRRPQQHGASSSSSSSSPTESEAVCYMQKDPAVEARALSSGQRFAVGCGVCTRDYGEGRVRSFDPTTGTYTVDVRVDGHVVTKALRAEQLVPPTVSELHIYPIKSCRGIRLDAARATARGLAHDRHWMIIDTAGKFITQRRYHKLALLTPVLDDLENPTALTLTGPDMGDLRVPIQRQGPEVPTRVWKSDMVAVDQGDAAAAWLDAYLADVRGERRFRLVYVKDAFRRAVNPTFAPGHETVFADGYPFLVALEASLEAVNETLEEPIPINRFRANIIVRGAPAFADETWNALTIGGVHFRNVKPCDRCNMPTIDQATGLAHPKGEPQKTLTETRNGQALGFINGTRRSYYFGSNLVAETSGRLDVGAEVCVLTMKERVAT